MDAIAARLAADYPRTNTDVGARVVPLESSPFGRRFEVGGRLGVFD